MVVSLNVKGLPGLQRKLKPAHLYEPAIAEVVEKVGKRMERGGKGLGAKSNTITREPQRLSATVSTTLNNPRQTGAAWERKQRAIARAMAPRVLRSAQRKIIKAWSA